MSTDLSLEAARAQYGRDVVRRAARHDAWRAGELDYQCSEIQMRAKRLVSESRRPVWLTSRRFGKSRTACNESTEVALCHPGVWIPYAAGTREQVKRFVHPHMTRLAEQAPDDIAPELVEGEWRFPPLQWTDARGNPVRCKSAGGVELSRFKGKKHQETMLRSIIVPVGCENRTYADRLRGPGTMFGVVDEAGSVPVLDYVLGDVMGPMLWEARSIWGDDVHKALLVTGTPPEHPDHPYNRVITEAEAEGRLLHATIYDCDHLDEKDIADAITDAGGEHTMRWQREGLAKVVTDPEQTVLPEMSEHERVIVGEWQRPEHFLPHVIGDVGFIDMDVLLFGYYDFEADVDVIEDEVTMRRATSEMLDAACAEMEKKLWPGRKVHRRKVDAQPRVRADMSRENFQAESDEDVVRHWSAVEKKNGGSVVAGANATRLRLGRARVRISRKCKVTIAHAKAARWNIGRDNLERVKDERGRPLHHFDGCASLIYFERNLDRSTNPVPRLERGITSATHHIPDELRGEPKPERAIFRRTRGKR